MRIKRLLLLIGILSFLAPMSAQAGRPKPRKAGRNAAHDSAAVHAAKHPKTSNPVYPKKPYKPTWKNR